MSATVPDSRVDNPVGLLGIAFLEFAGPDPAHFNTVFLNLGLSKRKQHTGRAITLYQQQEIYFLYNQSSEGFAAQFSKLHGQSACALGLRVRDAQFAFEEAVRRGARPCPAEQTDHVLPAVYGVGDSLIYFVENWEAYLATEFVAHASPEEVPDKGFLFVDHMTNNVETGARDRWASFYKDIFGFTEIRYFDIKGKKTGLTSFALKSPCQTFSIPINEATDEKSQIAEYIREYHGAGIQHIALASNDLLASLDRLEGRVETLDIDPEYYEEAFARVPNVTEDHEHIQRHSVLVDGDEEGYLLQIFSKNLFGPIFFEMIQRKNHHSFGEGNFGALFKSIERDQERRGVL